METDFHNKTNYGVNQPGARLITTQSALGLEFKSAYLLWLEDFDRALILRLHPSLLPPFGLSFCHSFFLCYRLKFIALNTQSTIRNVIENTLIENGIDSRQFKIEMELNSIEAIKNAVQSGLGAAFVSVSAISKELELNIIHWAKIKDITISRTLSIIVNPKRYYASSIKIFKREILDMFLVSSSFDNKLNLLWPEEEK